MRIHVASVGVLAPGLTGLAEARRAMAGEAAILPAAFTVPAAQCLPAAERRRASTASRLAIATAEQAIGAAALPASAMAMVFAAAESAPDITHQLCEVLAGTREVSPTVFHNSVHNAPLGYLSIAVGAKGSGTSVCRGEWTFAAALVLAALEAASTERPVLLVCYDSPFPPALAAACPVVCPTAISLVLTPARDERTLATCSLSIGPEAPADDWPAWIPADWRANASARGFMALAAWAGPGRARVRIPYAPGSSLEIRCDG